jgi:hypothetical protein
LPIPGPVPLLRAELAQVIDRLLGGDVVDQQLEAAEFGRGLLHRTLAVGFLGQVAADRQAPAPGLADQFGRPGGVLVLLFGQVRDRDVRAFLGEGHRDGAPNAGIAAGDQGPLAGQQARLDAGSGVPAITRTSAAITRTSAARLPLMGGGSRIGHSVPVVGQERSGDVRLAGPAVRAVTAGPRQVVPLARPRGRPAAWRSAADAAAAGTRDVRGIRLCRAGR